MAKSVVTPVRFARGMTFEQYVTYTGSPENLAREGFGSYNPAAGSIGRTGETVAQAKERDQREFLALQGSPFFDLWASAGIDEILSALYEKLTVKP